MDFKVIVFLILIERKSTKYEIINPTAKIRFNLFWILLLGSSSNFEIKIRNSLIIVLNFEPLFSLVENVDNDSMIIISNALLFLHFRFGKRKRKLWHIILQIEDTSNTLWWYFFPTTGADTC